MARTLILRFELPAVLNEVALRQSHFLTYRRTDFVDHAAQIASGDVGLNDDAE